MNSLLSLDNKHLSELGVIEWGYTEDSKPVSLSHFESWIEKQGHGSLTYLSDQRRDLRRDIKKVYPDFASALVFLFSYHPTKKWLLESQQHQLAAYSLGFDGEDYHFNLKSKLASVAQKIKTEFPNMEFFISLDAQPILERDLAHRAGLGWFGKNSMLIHQKHGSYFLIGSLLLNQKLPIKTSNFDTDHCGQCSACVDACPTQAIDGDTRTIEAQKCISTFTIETFKESPAPKGMLESRGEIFGCDICQDVCPWNKKSLEKVLPDFKLAPPYGFIKDLFFSWSRSELYQFFEKQTNRGLKRILKGTAFDRPGRVGWMKNLKTYFHPK